MRAVIIARSNLWVCVLALFLLGSTFYSANAQSSSKSTKAKLATPITDYDNQQKPLIQTLLALARDHHLPMGIERVVREAIEKPITVKIKKGTLATILAECVKQLPTYTWSVQNETIQIWTGNENKQSSNLMNTKIPSFEISNGSLNDANFTLRSLLFNQVNAPPKSGSGVAGSYIGNTALTEGKRITLKVKNVSVRSILNQLVSLHGEAVWIIRVEPERMSTLPSAGLWIMIPNSITNPVGVLDLKTSPAIPK